MLVSAECLFYQYVPILLVSFQHKLFHLHLLEFILNERLKRMKENM